MENTKYIVKAQCISCLFPMLRAYDTVLRLAAPGTGCQGIDIRDTYSVVSLLRWGHLFTLGTTHHSSLSSCLSLSWISILLITLRLEYFLLARLLLLSPYILLDFTQFLSWVGPASLLPEFHPVLVASYFRLSASPSVPVGFYCVSGPHSPTSPWLF